MRLSRFTELLLTFERYVVVSLIGMMMLAILVSTIELAVILYRELMKPPILLLEIDNLLEIFGFFMMILIGIELLETIRNYITEEYVHVEVVFLVAMIAVARKVIILDVKDLTPLTLLGIAAIIVALAAGYYGVKRSYTLPLRPSRRCDPPDAGAEDDQT